MVGIVSSGIGSGLDVQSLVQQIVAAEGQPAQQRLAFRETQFQARLSAYGSLKSALDTFKTSLQKLSEAETTAARSIATSNEDAVSVSVNESAVAASYTVDIVNTASVARLTSSAFADSDAVVGTGTLTLSLGSESFDVEIDSDNQSLAGIRDAINSASDNSGVQATIINADNGSYLVLSGTKTGSSNSLTITQSGGDGGLASISYDPGNGINNLVETQAASDAAATVNGFAVFSETNEFADVIEGVTFTALEATGGNTFSIDVSNDDGAVADAVRGFVSGYNALISTAENLSSFDAETKVAGPLQGDSALRGVTGLLRRELSNATNGASALFDTLSEIGVGLDEKGRLQIDSDKLNSVLESDFSAIGDLFGGDNGYTARLSTIIDTYIGDDGILEARTDGLDASIERISEQRESLNARLVSLEARLQRQFNGLDSLLGQLNNTSSFLTAQLANVPTPGRST